MGGADDRGAGEKGGPSPAPPWEGPLALSLPISGVGRALARTTKMPQTRGEL